MELASLRRRSALSCAHFYGTGQQLDSKGLASPCSKNDSPPTQISESPALVTWLTDPPGHRPYQDRHKPHCCMG
jgi:hypothetical protein